ncbi:N-acetylmuramoyl-L-alanine amidase [Halalkalibacterium ligniniphilum]|uniref:N-acetylmuramoyl-L-alanine amidase n=1 Tax=Halalkalibacterium ligniniphilum TaxID=1134413 RepID=UPI000346B3F2|nr:N-acetylmuramoyl-L-alanine amidase [Halalkalibacterium ligniniphilum]
MLRKGIVASLIILLMLPVIGLETASAQGKFTDVPSSAWGHDEIHYLKDKGILNGRENGTVFAPNENLTRAQAAVMITNAIGEGSRPVNRSNPTFPDVSTDHWAYASIERAAALGIFSGRDGRFHPSERISRAQIAAVLSKTFSLSGGSVSSFSDIRNDFWALRQITSLEANGIVELGNNFRPNAQATRAEFAVYLARAIEPSFRLSSDGAVLFRGAVNVTSTLNVRSGPSTSNGVIGSLSKGQTIEVYGIEGDWLRIKYNGNFGYVHQSYIQRVNEGAPSQPTPPPATDAKVIAQGKVTTASLNVRERATASSNTVGRLTAGTVVDIYAYEGNWAKIKYNGEFAYTSLHYLVTRAPGSNALKDRIIVIDPGHGGRDPGAVANGLREKDVVLAVGLELEKLLKDAGAKPLMTRNNDTFVELSERARFANNAQADIFVSIHANAAGASSANGTETFWNGTYAAAESKSLAESINKRLVEELGTRDRGPKSANFAVIRETRMPSVLVELGFVTNSSDAAMMKRSDFNQKAARAILRGIEDYYGW